MNVSNRHDLCVDIVQEMVDEDLLNLNQLDDFDKICNRCIEIISERLSDYILVDGNIF